MRLSATRLLTQGITHLFSRICPWWFIIIGIAGSLLLSLFYETIVPRYPGMEYLYQVVLIVFNVWWYFAATSTLIKGQRDGGCDAGYGMKRAFGVTSGAWWLIAWMSLLWWATIPLTQRSFCYNETVDLLAFLAVMALLIFQLGLNFFMIPALADGEDRHPIRLYVRSFDAFRRYFPEVARFFLALALLWGGLFVFVTYVFSLLIACTECVVTCSWYHFVPRMFILAITNTLVTFVLAHSQVVFYEPERAEPSW